jgi:hypothetical protein
MPVSGRNDLEQLAIALLQHEMPIPKPVRLLGVSLSSLAGRVKGAAARAADLKNGPRLAVRRNVGALAGERDGDGPADSAVAAGDDGSLVLRAAGAPVARHLRDCYAPLRLCL